MQLVDGGDYMSIILVRSQQKAGAYDEMRDELKARLMTDLK